MLQLDRGQPPTELTMLMRHSFGDLACLGKSHVSDVLWFDHCQLSVELTTLMRYYMFVHLARLEKSYVSNVLRLDGWQPSIEVRSQSK